MFIQKNILKIYTRVSMTLKLFFLLFYYSSTFELFHSNSSYRRLWMFFFIFQMRFLWCTTHMCIFVVFMSLTSFYLYATKKSCWLTGEIKKEHIKLMLINFFRLMDVHIFYKVTWNVIGWINHGKKPASKLQKILLFTSLVLWSSFPFTSLVVLVACLVRLNSLGFSLLQFEIQPNSAELIEFCWIGLYTLNKLNCAE